MSSFKAESLLVSRLLLSQNIIVFGKDIFVIRSNANTFQI